MERKAGQSALLFILLNKPGFRYTLLAIMLCFLAAAFYVAPIWNIAPPTYGESVRSSLYRIHEARSWKDKAIESVSQDDLKETAFLLRMAMSKNSMDPDLYRMTITNGMAFETQSPSEIREVALSGERLLTLMATNAVDLELVLSYNRVRGQDASSIDLLLGLSNPNPVQVAELLQLLYQARRIEDFQTVYELHAKSLPSDDRTEIDQYHMAVMALDADTKEHTLSLVEEMKAGSDTSLGRRLLLDVYEHLGAVDQYNEVFQGIQRNQEDQPEQHASYWQLLSTSGKPDHAQMLAAQYWPEVVQLRFVRLDPVVQLARAYLKLGLLDQSKEIFQMVEPVFEDNPQYWIAFGDSLIEGEQWQTVISHAVKLRSQKGGISFTKAYAFFIEGFAQGKQNLNSSATTTFKRLIKQGPVNHVALATRMAKGIVEVGQGKLALEFLNLHDDMIQDREAYYDLMFQAAKLAGNPSALSMSLKSLRETNPSVSGMAKRQLEEAVLILSETDDPLQSFIQSTSEQEWSDADRLMVASARWLQGDLSGLDHQLDAIDLESLESYEQALLTLIRMDRLVQEGQLEEARGQISMVIEKDLFPGYTAKLKSLEIQINSPNLESP